jgi:hypothetical protein
MQTSLPVVAEDHELPDRAKAWNGSTRDPLAKWSPRRLYLNNRTHRAARITFASRRCCYVSPTTLGSVILSLWLLSTIGAINGDGWYGHGTVAIELRRLCGQELNGRPGEG